MEKITLDVNGMSCEHCVRAVNEAVGALEGVKAVQVDLAKGTAAVEFDAGKVTLDAIKHAIQEEGYEVA